MVELSAVSATSKHLYELAQESSLWESVKREAVMCLLSVMLPSGLHGAMVVAAGVALGAP